MVFQRCCILAKNIPNISVKRGIRIIQGIRAIKKCMFSMTLMLLQIVHILPIRNAMIKAAKW
jgi:hypothetical protein